ncbi:hypothetical protein [Neobacillus sp. D3-1R]
MPIEMKHNKPFTMTSNVLPFRKLVIVPLASNRERMSQNANLYWL